MAVGPLSDHTYLADLSGRAPVVAVDTHTRDWQGDGVNGDNRFGMELAVSHLVDLGHRAIAFINGDTTLSTAAERRAGFEESMRRIGLAPLAIREGVFRMESGKIQVESILAEGRAPTAICAGNDLLALGAIAALRDAHLCVPEDVSVVGYDDIPYAQLASPPLTTVKQPAELMGRQAARLLLLRLNQRGEQVRQVVLAPQLVVRQSTSAAAVRPARIAS